MKAGNPRAFAASNGPGMEQEGRDMGPIRIGLVVVAALGVAAAAWYYWPGEEAVPAPLPVAKAPAAKTTAAKPPAAKKTPPASS